MDVDAAAEPPAKRTRLENGDEGVSWPGARGSLQSIDTSKSGPLLACDVGIMAFVDAEIPAFSAIVKHRFLDFLVNEVTKEGKVCVLKDISRPVERSEQAPTPKDEAKDAKWPEDAQQLLADLLTPEKIAAFEVFHARGPPASASKKVRHRNDPIPEDQRILSDPVESKETRKAFHQRIREIFGGVFITEAIEAEGGQIIQIMWAQGNDERDRRSHPRPASHHKFIHFRLQKRNRDSHDSIGAIASALNVHARDLGVTGTKDKRAVTVQRVSLRRGNHTLGDVWQAVNGGGRGRSNRGRGGRGRGRGGKADVRGGTPCFDLKVGDLSYEPSGLELGDLGGNRFRLVLRDVQAESEDVVSRAVSSLRDNGFVNYFGMQRFGNSCIGTHIVGLAILQGNFDLASDLLLRPRNDDFPQAAEARRIFMESRDANAALKIMPRNCIAERSLLSFYAKHGFGNHATAIASIAKNLRMMYVHAYQSRLWNIVVSERIRLFGARKPVVGDLVLAKGGEAAEESLDEPSEMDDTTASEVNGTAVDASEDTRPNAEAIAELRKTAHRPEVRVLTESDVCDFTIFDVVLPLAGFLVTYPAGDLGQRYRELLLADGLDPDDLYRKQKEYSMAGVYRKIVHRPQDLEWSLVRYGEPDHQLALCDEDAILGRTLAEPPADGKYLALKLDFTLKSSTYATMALREMLKSETASSAQKALTQDMQARANASTDAV